MKIKIAFFAIIWLSVMLEVSFLAVLFPFEKAPNLILALAIAFTLVLGFSKAWPWIATLGILADLFSFGFPGENLVFLIFISYIFELLKWYFSARSGLAKFLVAGFFLALAAVLENFWQYFLVFCQTSFWEEKALFSFSGIFFQFAFNIFLFYFVLTFLKKINSYLARSNV